MTLTQTAIIIGGSITGLMAARVLSKHFAHVLVIERDQLPAGPESRKGTPQGHHAHILLSAGLARMQKWFPGLEEELEREGITKVDFGCDLRWLHRGSWFGRFPGGLVGWATSRAYLEWKFRTYVQQTPNIKILDGRTAVGLRHERGRVIGAICNGELIRADLVIDASGRGSRTPQWLEELGYGRPTATRVGIDLAYASRSYKIPAGDCDWKLLGIFESAPGKRQGVILPIEGDRWIVSLVGYHGHHTPLDEAGFLATAANLVAPDLYQAIKDAEPLSPISQFKIPASLRYHYERMERFPEGLLPIGDAVANFNPAYGQGMSVASLGVELLEEMLEQGSLNSRAFFKGLSQKLMLPWLMNLTEDFRHQETVGTRPWGHSLLTQYTDRVIKVAAGDADVMHRFQQVMHMVKPPTALMNPRTLLKVLFSGGSGDSVATVGMATNGGA